MLFNSKGKRPIMLMIRALDKRVLGVIRHLFLPIHALNFKCRGEIMFSDLPLRI